MKRTVATSVKFLILSVILMTGCRNNQNVVTKESTESSKDQLIQRGSYLVTVMGCHDCHSPKQENPQGPVLITDLLLSGYPANRPIEKADPELIKKGWILFIADLTSSAGPWGISFAANLSSDQTGIGNWTEDNFKRALKEGKFKGLEGSRTLLPPMPWPNFTDITDEDVKAIFAYLMSTRPVNNVVPPPVSLITL